MGKHPCPPSGDACQPSKAAGRGHFLVPEFGCPVRKAPHWTHGAALKAPREGSGVSAEKPGMGRRRDESAIGGEDSLGSLGEMAGQGG